MLGREVFGRAQESPVELGLVLRFRVKLPSDEPVGDVDVLLFFFVGGFFLEKVASFGVLKMG